MKDLRQFPFKKVVKGKWFVFTGDHHQRLHFHRARVNVPCYDQNEPQLSFIYHLHHP